MNLIEFEKILTAGSIEIQLFCVWFGLVWYNELITVRVRNLKFFENMIGTVLSNFQLN